MLGLRFCARALPSCSKREPPLIAVRGPLTIAASLVAEHRLQTRRLSNCGSRAQPLRSMRDPPRPGLEPVSPAPAGRPPTTAPPGKPSIVFKQLYNIHNLFEHRSFFILGTSITIYQNTRVQGTQFRKPIIVENTWVLGCVFKSLALILTSCVTLEELLNLSEPPFKFAFHPKFIEHLWCSRQITRHSKQNRHTPPSGNLGSGRR